MNTVEMIRSIMNSRHVENDSGDEIYFYEYGGNEFAVTGLDLNTVLQPLLDEITRLQSLNGVLASTSNVVEMFRQFVE